MGKIQDGLGRLFCGSPVRLSVPGSEMRIDGCAAGWVFPERARGPRESSAFGV